MVTRSAGIGPSPIKWKAHDTQVEEDLRREWLRNDRTAARRPLFRGMSAADSEEARNSGRLHIGISGRVPSERVADLRRNQWPAWVGIRNPKGDIELFSKIVQTAAECGRLEDLMLLTPIFPDESVYLDPLSSYYMEDELVNHIVSGIKAREDFYIAIATQVAQVVVSGLIVLAKAKGIPPQNNPLNPINRYNPNTPFRPLNTFPDRQR